AKAPKAVRGKIVQALFSRRLFPKGKISFIFIFQTLDHIPEPDKFLRECMTVLKPGGFILSFHHDVESWSAHLLGEKSPIIDVEHTQLFSIDTSRQLFEKVGMEVTEDYSPVSFVSLKHLIWLFPFPNSVKEILVGNAALKGLLSTTIPLRMGNVCIVGEKI
ncbi:MAG TPA: class I SAM-dependent methyltransferase, partial [Patescibacteria group bacterium]|nr:class I SAM-dependent methyltransferase [Patescibacteria group bacterium]